jgi:hypothetical protein
MAQSAFAICRVEYRFVMKVRLQEDVVKHESEMKSEKLLGSAHANKTGGSIGDAPQTNPHHSSPALPTLQSGNKYIARSIRQFNNCIAFRC